MDQALQNMREAKAALLLRGWPSVAAWSAAHGFLPVTVRSTIYHWWHRQDREPLGGMGRQIMAALKAELAKPERRAA